MNQMEYRFIEPLDVLFLRGNKLFGDPGSYGEALVPPWPSVAAGALRSRMLADAGVDFAQFARGGITHPTLGTPEAPGSFRVTSFQLARRYGDGRLDALLSLPADLVITEDGARNPSARRLAPTEFAAGDGRLIASSAPFAYLPVLAETERSKPVSGYWLTGSGWRRYLAGETPQPADLIPSNALWRLEGRVGVGLDAVTRRAADGRLFTVQAVAMVKRGHACGAKQSNGTADYDVGFLAAVAGAEPPKEGTLRLGGDGRAAALVSATFDCPEPDYAAIAAAGRARLVLTSPGIFARGWQPTGTAEAVEGGFLFDLQGVRGRLVCAAVPRAEVVSGWDLAKWQPKAAQRAAPTGSVYWLKEIDASAEALRKLVERGLWSEPCEDVQRRAEGFNRFTFAAY